MRIQHHHRRVYVSTAVCGECGQGNAVVSEISAAVKFVEEEEEWFVVRRAVRHHHHHRGDDEPGMMSRLHVLDC